MNRLFFCTVSVVTVMASACGPAPAPNESGETPSTPASSASSLGRSATSDLVGPDGEAWNSSGSPVPGTSLTISPNPMDFCDGVPKVSQVAWDAAAASPGRLNIYVRDGQAQFKLWASPPTPVGERATGAWIRPGVTFVAVDRMTERVINSVTVEGVTCN